MAKINLDAIKAKIERLKNEKDSKIPRWKPDLGEHLIRIIPWNDTPEDDPYKSLEFYYNILEKGSILCPKQFGEPDPVQELASKLWKGDKEDKENAKKLFPNTRYYAKIIDRSNEDGGPILWAFGRNVYLRLMSFFADEDIEDYLDVDDGFDLKVNVKKQGAKINGRDVFTTDIDVARKRSKLSKDPKKVKEWSEVELNPLDMFKKRSYDEITKILDDWLKGPSEEDGLNKGEESETLDDALNSLKTDEKKSKSKRKSVSEDEIVASSDSSIDDVFESVLGSSEEDAA